MSTTSGPSAIAAAGLVLDIAGALLLALALIFAKPDQRLEEATPKWDFNVDLEVGLAEQTADAQAGAFLLMLGFTLQLGAVLGWHLMGWAAAVPAIVIATVFDLVIYALLRFLWRPHHAREMLAARLRITDFDPWWPALSIYGDRLGYSYDAANETIEDYGKRILGSTRWASVTRGRELPAFITKLRHDLPGTPEFEEAHSRGEGGA